MTTPTGWLSRILAASLMILLALSSQVASYAQQPFHLSIDQAYQLARENYPLIKQRNLIAKTRDYTLLNAAKGFLPTLTINGQATYQSAVTSFPFDIPIPGFKLPTFNKDQYKLYAQVDQVIYDGGAIKNQQQIAEANQVIQQQNIEVELYALYDRVNQLFFGTLLINEQLIQNTLLQKDIQNGIDKAKALVANGTAFRSSVDEITAQLLQAQQSQTELQANRKAFLDMLGLMINQHLDEQTILDSPPTPNLTDSIQRPELLFYDLQRTTYDLQDQLLKIQLLPKFSAYLQGGYGRPGLNLLSNDFALYYIGGVRMNWNLGSYYTLKNQRELSGINRKSLDVQKESFLFNARITQKQQNADAEKYLELLKKDDDIIRLRESVKHAASAQLENGVLSAHDYLTSVNSEDQARQNRILHQMQRLQAQYNYQNTTGNIKN